MTLFLLTLSLVRGNPLQQTHRYVTGGWKENTCRCAQLMQKQLAQQLTSLRSELSAKLISPIYTFHSRLLYLTANADTDLSLSKLLFLLKLLYQPLRKQREKDFRPRVESGDAAPTIAYDATDLPLLDGHLGMLGSWASKPLLWSAGTDWLLGLHRQGVWWLSWRHYRPSADPHKHLSASHPIAAAVKMVQFTIPGKMVEIGVFGVGLMMGGVEGFATEPQSCLCGGSEEQHLSRGAAEEMVTPGGRGARQQAKCSSEREWVRRP